MVPRFLRPLSIGTGGVFIWSRKDLFYDHLESAKDAVQREQEAVARQESRRSAQQLHMIAKELVRMGQAVAGEEPFEPYYPKGIADAWPKDDPLGLRLGRLANLYYKVQMERKIRPGVLKRIINKLKEKDK